MGSKLDYKIIGSPDYSLLRVKLPPSVELKVEAGAMVAIDTHYRMQSEFRGAAKRFLSGESLFINRFSFAHSPGTIDIAPAAPGDIAHLELLNNEKACRYFLRNSSFLAATKSITCNPKWQGFSRGIFSDAGLFLIQVEGTGDLFFNALGGIFSLDVDGEAVLDTGHILAFSSGLDYRISKLSGYRSLFFSGEGFVCRFRGKGKVWVQGRKVKAFSRWIRPFRRVRRRRN